jgi:hypothetical protein
MLFLNDAVSIHDVVLDNRHKYTGKIMSTVYFPNPDHLAFFPSILVYTGTLNSLSTSNRTDIPR